MWNTTTLANQSDVLQVLVELRGKRWMCRGQSKQYGSLMPSIDREPRQNLSRVEKLTLERRSIDLFRSTARFFSDKSEQDALSGDVGALMLLRHYDVPTRLLDWSLSPYVAAYFSVCDKDNEDGEIWSFDEPYYAQKGTEQWIEIPETTIDGSGDASKFDMSLPTAFGVKEPRDWFVCFFYSHAFHRQKAQEGAYSITPCFGRDHAAAIADLLRDQDRYHLYIVKAQLKPDLRNILREKHGIWQGSLFPDVAGAAGTAKTVFQDSV